MRLRPGSEAEMVALFLRTELPAPASGTPFGRCSSKPAYPSAWSPAPNLGDPAEDDTLGHDHVLSDLAGC